MKPDTSGLRNVPDYHEGGYAFGYPCETYEEASVVGRKTNKDFHILKIKENQYQIYIEE